MLPEAAKTLRVMNLQVKMSESMVGHSTIDTTTSLASRVVACEINQLER
jgi:hypothetical protein